MADEQDEGLDRAKLLDEFERAAFTSEVIRAQPIPIPEGIIGTRRPTESIAVRSDAGERIVLHWAPALVVLTVAAFWTAAGLHRGELAAFAAACALTCTAVAALWATVVRAF